MGILTDTLAGLAGRGAGTAFTPEAPAGMDERRADIIRWWTYYHGADPATGRTQWDYLRQRFETIPRRAMEDIENHTRICTDRLRRLLVNSWRGFAFDDPETGRLVGDVLARNRWPRLLGMAVLHGRVTGDAFIKLSPAPPDGVYGPVRLSLLDPESVSLEVSPHDRFDVRSVTVSYDFLERGGDDGTGSRNDGSHRRNTNGGGMMHRWRRAVTGMGGHTLPGARGPWRRRTYTEYIDDRSVTAFIDGDYAPDWSYEHDLGFIPVAHVRNSDAGGVYGESYVGRLTEAQDSLNLLASDLMDMVRHDGHKTTIFQNVVIDTGASRDGATPGEVDLSIGRGLVVKGDGRVYKLDHQHDLGAALEEYDRKLDAFYDLAGVPRLSRDVVRGLGSLSGRAIERLHQDAIESTREAQGLYGDGFGAMAGMVARMLGRGGADPGTLWNTDVIQADIDTLAREHEVGARSLRSVMRRLGITDIERMERELAEEKARAAGGDEGCHTTA